jgi:ParB family chromosome partitioning protein
VVRQRLKLANVSAKIIAAYRKGDLDLECVMAFAVTDDHKAQERVWKEWRSYPEYQREADNIRAMLTAQHIEADSKLALFVTVKAYEKAGGSGSVIRDLFDADSEGWLTDAELLNRLVAEKLEGEAAAVRAEGWQWVEIMPDVAWDTLRSFDRIHPAPTEQQQEALDQLHAERDKLDEEDSDQADKLFAKIEKLESEFAFTDEQKAKSGAIISIGHDGTLEIEAGLVRPEDRERTKKAKAEGDADNAPPCFSAALIEDLTAHRTAALQAMLADNPKAALAAVVHALALGVFYHGEADSCLQIMPRVVYLDRSAEGIAETAAHKQLEATTKAMRKRLPKQGGKLWGWLQKQDQKTLLALLAVSAGHTVDAVEKRQGTDDRQHAQQLAVTLKLDMADYWQPTAAGYFSRVSKEQVLTAIGEACGANAKGGYVTLKKAALADAAEAKLKGSRWLPDLLRAA